jgi:hypothetical protein
MTGQNREMVYSIFFSTPIGVEKKKASALNVYGFDDDSVNRILSVLQNKFNLICTLHMHYTKKGYRIYIHKESMAALIILVCEALRSPYMIPSMNSKIGL